MHAFRFANAILGLLALASWASGPFLSALAHEAHKMECTQTHINAMNIDVQAMDDGEAKTTATKELRLAEERLASQDMQGCETHLHNATEAMEK